MEVICSFGKSINLAVASATALAMRLVQLNLAATGGHLNATRGLFAPMHKHVNINVPTLPQIEFQFDAFDSIGLNDKFDVFIFSFKPEFVPTGVTPETLRSNYSSVFDLNAIIRNPLILPQTINEMQWPGDGRGPKRTPCLMASCGFGRCSCCLRAKPRFFSSLFANVLFAASCGFRSSGPPLPVHCLRVQVR